MSRHYTHQIKQGSKIITLKISASKRLNSPFNNAMLNVKAFLVGFSILSLIITEREVGMVLRPAK